MDDIFEEDIEESKKDRLSNIKRASSFLDHLSNSSSKINIETRAENSISSGISFITLLEKNIEDEEWRAKLIFSFLKSIKEKDYKRFKRIYNKYLRETK